MRTFITAFIVLGMLSSLWALASPLMSSPDEPAHTIKAAAVVRGQLQGKNGAAQGERTVVTVPAYIASVEGLPACFAWKPLVAAGCAPQVPASDTNPVEARTSAGNYNPMYYAVTGLPSLVFSGAKAIYAMRIASALIVSAFLALALASLASLRRGRLPLLIGAVSLTPMVLYLGGAINPNALEIGASMAVFATLCLALERMGSSATWKRPLAAMAVSAAILANTRAASLLWLALAVGAALLIFGRRPLQLAVRQRFVWLMAAIVAAGCGLSILWLKTADSFQSLLGEGIDATPIQIVAVMLDRTFEFAAGYVSYLGWLDTRGPSGVLVIWSVLIGATLIAALSFSRRSSRFAVGGLLLAMVALPPLLQIPLAKDVGYIWQGRYILALLVVMTAACAVALRHVSLPRGTAVRRSVGITVGLAVFGHFYSFVFGLRRYTIGLQESSNWSDMVDKAQWQPPLGWVALALLYLAVLVAAAVVLHRAVFAGADGDTRLLDDARLIGDASLPEERAIDGRRGEGKPVRARQQDKLTSPAVSGPEAGNS